MLTPAPFPGATAWSLILGAKDRNSPQWRKNLDRLVQRYWKPVWWFLVRRWSCSPEDAADLAQEFFARLYSDDILQKASPERGRFRTFLKLELRDLVIDSLRKKTAQKRGGGASVVPIDDARAPDPAWSGLPPEEEFDLVWATSLLSSALDELGEQLKAEGKEPVFRAYWNCAVADPPKSYKECAEEIGVKVNDICNYVYRARAALRVIVANRVRESVEREEDVQPELEYILRLLRK